MRMQQFESVEAYLEAQPPAFRKALETLRAQIKAAAPKAEESISYGMPAYKYKGPLVYFGAFKKHCSFFPGSSSILQNEKNLKGFTVAKGTIQFTPEKPLPAALIKRIVKERIKENETRDLIRQSKKSKK
ncbi:MAG: DUF1801 domain-containing protein [Cyclobacteriaceae bacterium]|nr:DUF1801 domain-containing protein [Cyclobacteriaceae bacterium]